MANNPIQWQQNVWSALRANMQASPPELAVLATTETVKVRADQAARYMRALAHAGYVIRCGSGVYRISPQYSKFGTAPHAYQVVEVYDHTTAQVVARTGPAGFSRSPK